MEGWKWRTSLQPAHVAFDPCSTPRGAHRGARWRTSGGRPAARTRCADGRCPGKDRGRQQQPALGNGHDRRALLELVDETRAAPSRVAPSANWRSLSTVRTASAIRAGDAARAPTVRRPRRSSRRPGSDHAVASDVAGCPAAGESSTSNGCRWSTTGTETMGSSSSMFWRRRATART
jgi:hypothetical protein